jgi:hypothetical protein
MYLIGYQYYGGYPYAHLWTAGSKRPLRSHDKATLPLFGDVTENKAISGQPHTWHYTAHAKGRNGAGAQFVNAPPEACTA